MSRDDNIADLEKQLKKKDHYISELEKDSRTKSEFLLSMGHEIRRPMNGIMGMTNLVLETELSSEQRSHLEMVNDSAERLLEIVNDILDFSLIESGKLAFNLEDFNLTESLDYDLYLMKLSARQKGIDLEYLHGQDVPELLNSDPDRLVQVISNLVNNAIKFTEKGKITVRVENVSPDPDGPVTLKFSVADTGIGISPEKQKIIADTLQQTDASYSKQFWGGRAGADHIGTTGSPCRR